MQGCWQISRRSRNEHAGRSGTDGHPAFLRLHFRSGLPGMKTRFRGAERVWSGIETVLSTTEKVLSGIEKVESVMEKVWSATEKVSSVSKRLSP